MKTINMLSRADMVKGQGVLSAKEGQVELVKEELFQYRVIENKRNICDIMHFHTINPEFLLLIPNAKRKGVCVGYVHFLPETVETSLTIPKWAKKLFYSYMLFFYRKMDYLVTVNPYFIDALVNYGVPRERITYIPNFVSEQEFYPLPNVNKGDLREKYQLKKDSFTILCVGQLQMRKGIFDFIEIAEQMPECQFIWAGSFAFGKISNGYEQIKEKIKKLPSNVKLLGLIDRNKMNEIYNLADVMFLPSYEELFPMTILESMNCQIPILVRDLELYDEILKDYCLKGKDNQDFMSVIRQLYLDQDYYEYAKNKAFAGHLFYSRKSVANMWRKFYEMVAKK